LIEQSFVLFLMQAFLTLSLLCLACLATADNRVISGELSNSGRSLLQGATFPHL
jgi:hypothetical protein